MSTGNLFPSQQRARFMSITLSRYNHLCERHTQKQLPAPVFSVAQLRSHLLDALGDSYDGAIQCKYCGRMCDISEVNLDHADPIERGGSLDLDNIEFPCAQCNGAKGETTSLEFERFMALRKEMPLGFLSLYNRLAMFSKLMAGKRRAEILLRNDGKMPAKRGKPGKPPLIEAIDEHF